jgi:peptidoglycan/LPS O-acetylase OafA/YrhL
MTLGSKLAARHNNFDFIRLVAAWLVLLSHSYVFTMGGPDPWARLCGFDTAGGLAVAAFFVISGFLIARSFIEDPHVLRYLAKRTLRIFPALAACVIVTVVVFGPLWTSLPLGEYFHHPATWGYLHCISLYDIRYSLPGVFTNNLTPAVNGSLWTLPIEFAMYLAVMGLAMLGLMRRGWCLVGPVMVLVGQFVLMPRYFPELRVFCGLTLPEAFHLAWVFLLGSLAYVYRDRIVLDRRIFWAVMVGIGLSFRHGAWGEFLFTLLLPYAIFYLAFLDVEWPKKLTRRGDVSYGFYVYAFPFQQALVQHFGMTGLNFYVYVAAASVLTFVAATLSWRYVEKPALRLKPFRKAARTNEVMTISTPLAEPMPLVLS